MFFMTALRLIKQVVHNTYYDLLMCKLNLPRQIFNISSLVLVTTLYQP